MSSLKSCNPNILRSVVRRIDLATRLSLRHKPNRSGTDLDFHGKWFFLVSLVLSVRSRDNFVNKKMSEINFRKKLSKKQVQNSSLEDLNVSLRSFGLFSSKAQTIKDLSKLNYPISSKKIKKIKGVGQKIYDVYSNQIEGKDNVAVDTHTRQLFNNLSNYNLNEMQVRKVLNSIEGDFKRNRHIVMVRFNKNGVWCKDLNCGVCKSIKKSLLFLSKAEYNSNSDTS